MYMYNGKTQLYFGEECNQCMYIVLFRPSQMPRLGWQWFSRNENFHVTLNYMHYLYTCSLHYSYSAVCKHYIHIMSNIMIYIIVHWVVSYSTVADPGKISIGWGCNPSLCLFRLKKGEGVEETWNGKKMTPSSFKQYSIKESVATPVPPSRPATAPSILP